jgi:hypothetical protein
LPARRGLRAGPQEILDVLDVFGGEGVRMYMVGHLEGVEDKREREIEKYEDIEFELAFEVNESSVSVLRETDDLLRLRVEAAPQSLCTDVDFYIVDDHEVV